MYPPLFKYVEPFLCFFICKQNDIQGLLWKRSQHVKVTYASAKSQTYSIILPQSTKKINRSSSCKQQKGRLNDTDHICTPGDPNCESELEQTFTDATSGTITCSFLVSCVIIKNCYHPYYFVSKLQMQHTTDASTVLRKEDLFFAFMIPLWIQHCLYSIVCYVPKRIILKINKSKWINCMDWTKYIIFAACSLIELYVFPNFVKFDRFLIFNFT